MNGSDRMRKLAADLEQGFKNGAADCLDHQTTVDTLQLAADLGDALRDIVAVVSVEYEWMDDDQAASTNAELQRRAQARDDALARLDAWGES